MNADANMPTMTASAHHHNIYQGGQLGNFGQLNFPNASGNAVTLTGVASGSALGNLAQYVQPLPYRIDSHMMNGKGKLRVVRVFLVDPDERVPLDKRVLHRTAEMTTDATDQELFFGIPVQDLLAQHNTVRTAIKWKDAKGDAEPLKEIRIRDLVMSVTTIAEFQSRAG